MRWGFKLWYIMLFFGISCIDEINLDIDKNEPILAIQGLITDSLDNYEIKIHFSAPLGVGNDNLLTPVGNAQVRILDDAGNIYEFAGTEPGIYSNRMQGEIGKSYQLEIVLSEGKTVRSKPALLIKAPKIGQIKSEVFEETSFNPTGNVVVDTRLILKMETSFDEFTTKPFLRWRVDGEYEFKENYPMAFNTKICYVKNQVDLNNLRIFDTRTLNGNQIFDEIIVNTTLDYRFARQYCFHIKQYSMTEEEFLYWDAVNDIINIDGSLFDPPPGTVKGNLFNIDDPHELVVGYFSVNGVQSRRYFANPKSLKQVHIDPKCRGRYNQPYGPDCYDCTTIHNSTLIRPEYWQP
jgi:hypothetical protein